MTTLCLSTPTGIHFRRPTGERGFIPESASTWEREREVPYAPLRLSTRQRTARALGIKCREVRVVRTLEELKCDG
jgi:hypothetical protein